MMTVSQHAGNLGLKSALGASYNVDPNDVVTVKQALTRTGDYSSKASDRMDSIPDSELFVGIKRFQNRHGLNVDGVIRPDGETDRMLHRFSDSSEKEGQDKNSNEDDSSSDENQCPEGQYSVTRSYCIPGTRICYRETKCVPYSRPSGMGTRG